MATRTTPVCLSSETVSSVTSDTGDDATSIAGPSPLTSRGRPKISPVWEYFIYDHTTDKSICQVASETPETESVCGKSVTGKFPTNLKQHLRLAHPSVMKEVSRKEEEAKKAKEEAESSKRAASLKYTRQATLKETLTNRNPYSKDSARYRDITRKLAIFVGSCNVANRIVENLEFKDLLSTLDTRYQMPGRSSIHKELDKIMIELKAKICAYIQSASAVSICCDVWSKKGLTSSYLGIMAHFFSRNDHRRHVVTLAVRRLHTSHTAANIRKLVDEILEEWDIAPDKVSAVITDNGSNMVAAFKATLDKTEEEDDAEEEDSTPPDEADDFLDHEMEHDIEFCSLKRIACFSHTLQLVVSKFDEATQLKELMKRAHALVRKINSSTKATETLVALSGKKLIKDCPTRWSSTFLMLNRLLELKEHLKTVLEQQGWDDLAASEWRKIKGVVHLLQPFAKFTSLLSGDEFTTLSCVIPAIMDMNIHLEEVRVYNIMFN